MVGVTGQRRSVAVSGTLAITVHGQAGVVDLLVPAGASADDVAREYAAQCRLAFVPALHTRSGTSLRRRASRWRTLGLASGAVLVAAGCPGRAGHAGTTASDRRRERC